MSAPQLWHLKIRLSYKGVDAVVQLLESMSMQAVSWWECEDALSSPELDDQGFFISEEFSVEGYCKTEPDANLINQQLQTLSTLLAIETPTFSIHPVDNSDWLETCYKQLEPRQLGQYYVYGSHNPDPVDSQVIPLKINAATAFGSGEHPTTSGCLLALDELSKNHQFTAMLDMGCGSGILAIAMAKTWKEGQVLAVDNDPESVRVTKQNAILNDCCNNLSTLISEGFADSKVSQAGPFDVITANILAKPLCMMAVDIKNCLMPQGFIILSGLLDRQKELVLSAYEKQDFSLEKTYLIDGWATLLLAQR